MGTRQVTERTNTRYTDIKHETVNKNSEQGIVEHEYETGTGLRHKSETGRGFWKLAMAACESEHERQGGSGFGNGRLQPYRIWISARILDRGLGFRQTTVGFRRWRLGGWFSELYQDPQRL